MRKRGLIFCIITFLIVTCIACGYQKVQDGGEQTQEGMTVTVADSIAGDVATSGDICESRREEPDPIKGIVQVQTDNQRGSGVLWDKQESFWCFVTAAHVVEGMEQAEVYFAEYDELCAVSVHCIEGLDLAFLQMDTALLTEEIEATYEACKAVSGEVKSGNSIWAVGYNASLEKLEYTGNVWEPWIYAEDFENYMLMCRCEAQPGMSGGAVLTLDEALAGIICGQNEEGILAVLPISVIEAQYDLFINY